MRKQCIPGRFSLPPRGLGTRLSIAQPTSYFRILGGHERPLPDLAAIVSHAIWMPVASVDVERSFSQYKHLLNDRRESITEENMKRLVMLYFNGDIEGHFKTNFKMFFNVSIIIQHD